MVLDEHLFPGLYFEHLAIMNGEVLDDVLLALVDVDALVGLGKTALVGHFGSGRLEAHSFLLGERFC
jgi:hypothetical protein